VAAVRANKTAVDESSGTCGVGVVPGAKVDVGWEDVVDTEEGVAVGFEVCEGAKVDDADGLAVCDDEVGVEEAVVPDGLKKIPDRKSVV
jgi:hypothetical protein